MKLPANSRTNEAEAAKKSRNLASVQKREKNLSLEIKNYQRKTMLNGIDQLEDLNSCYTLVQQSKAAGVNPMIVSNFKGKAILDNLHDLKIWFDANYFNRQTFKEFLADPLGSKLIDAWAASDPAVAENVKAQNHVKKAIVKVAQACESRKIDLDAPSQ